MAFSITYTSVVWTAGDIITEAKLDNMVANDQAYDAHSAQGLEFAETSTPSTPASNKVRIYPKSDGLMYSIDDSGTETVMASSTDGWNTARDTWVYASASSFTISGVNRTSIFTPGTRLKFTQSSSVKYAVVVSSSFSTNTTVNIAVNTDYTIANAAISSNYYSYEASPQGYPTWFTYTPVFTGFSADPTVISKFSILGKEVTWYLSTTANGTSNSTGFTITLPVTAVALARTLIYPIAVVDNSTGPTAPGRLEIGNGSTTATLYKDLNQTNFTNSGTKAATFALVYEM